MERQSNMRCMRCILAVITVVGVCVLSTCDVFMPNFLIGTWAAPGKYGDERLTFTKEGTFTAQFYNKDGSVLKRSGNYTAGKSVVQFSYKAESGRIEKSIAAYKMYPRSMDFIFKGKKTKYYKF